MQEHIDKLKEYVNEMMTDEALKAIPGLLKKYKINYRPEIEEKDEDFRKRYKEVNNL